MKNIYLEKFSDRFNKYKQRVSNKLNEQFKKYSVRKKKILLVSFCILFGSISLCVLINTFYERSFSKSIPLITPISIPYHVGKNFHQPGAMIDQDTYLRVEHFKKYLDSLKINNIGRYTEIMNTRPHLMDSIIAFEKIYITQLKK
jgi:hypothetical protein